MAIVAVKRRREEEDVSIRGIFEVLLKEAKICRVGRRFVGSFDEIHCCADHEGNIVSLSCREYAVLG